METRISSATREVIIGAGRPTVLVGERINPTGKKKLAEALGKGDLRLVCQEALSQVHAGADALDINVCATSVDEVTMLPAAVKAVMETVDVPLCLDSANIKALESALKVYKGKPLVNSVTGEETSLAKVLPVVKEYGAAVVGLLQDEEGIPNNPERRLAIAHKIIERAEKMGIPYEDVIIDCVACTVGADNSAGVASIETIRRIKSELGVNLTIAASNLSFGLPDRALFNNAFAVIAITAGVTCLIADVAKTRPTILAADLAMGHDEHARRYLQAYRQRQK